MIKAIHNYLDLVTGEPLPPETRLAALACSLDALAHAFHDLPDASPGEADNEAEVLTTQEFEQAAAVRFPELGLYSWIDPLAEIGSPGLAGDAIDDIADLAQNLAEGAWLWENISPSEGAWHLRLLYFHWGHHLMGLRGYLHALSGPA